jgi:hypothetical protein
MEREITRRYSERYYAAQAARERAGQAENG